MSTDSTCLVARAMPCAIPASQAIKAEFNGPDALIDDLKKLSLNKQNTPKPNKEKKGTRTMDTISPADFVTLQSLRSSALARKTNTTSKMARDGANLFADLLAEDKPVEKKEVTADDLAFSSLTLEEKKEAAEKKEEEIKAERAEEKSDKEDAEKKDSADKNDKEAEDEKDDKEGELISRGPVRTSRTPVTFHPYGGKTLHYGAAAQSAVEDPSSYSYGYDHNYDYSPNYYNASRNMLESNSSTPDTMFSDTGYSSATSPQNYYNNYYQPPTAPQQAYYPHAAVPVTQAQQPVQQSKTADTPSVGFADPLTSSELNRLLSTNTECETELPESLSDFILKYSRRYTSGSEEVDAYTTIKNSFSPSSSSSSPQHHHRPLSADSGCDSPLSAGSAPQTSPAQPHGGISGPSTPSSDQHRYQSKTGGTPMSVESQQRPAKEKLRALISDDDMDQAWAWTTKCMMYFPGALSYQDPDRDTLLHIVTKLMDFAKIYTLVERMLKLENAHNHKMFDMPNKMNETPLFLAVERRCPEIVEYLLEAGANPNIQTLRHERDASLHYAATRGMYDVVSTLCSSPKTNINAMNGMGLTPLLCAVKNHGSLEEESQRIIDSRMTIQQLLACGADPMIADVTNGRTVIHYVVDCTDPALIEIFKANIPEAVMMDLVNTPDLCSETPLNLLQSMVNIDESRRSTLCMELITCGANNQKPQTTYEQLY